MWRALKWRAQNANRAITRGVRTGYRRARVAHHGRQLRLVQDNTAAIGREDVLLVCCLRNELTRLPFFLRYYRDLGVDHFLIVDNDSNDGFLDWIRSHSDCSVWHTRASYLASDFGVEWWNYLLRAYGSGHLCITVDPDEFLVYPHMRTRNLRDLGLFLKDDERATMHTLMLDAYGAGTLAQTVYRRGDDPFAVCPYFDRDGYIQRPGMHESTWIQGGPRMRVHSHDMPLRAPALNKIPVAWWERSFSYRSSTHWGSPATLNRAHTRGEVSLTGCLFHFKLVSLLVDKANEEAVRKQHYANGHEYRSYREAGDEIRFYQEGVSVRYESPEQLIRLGLMSAGPWI
jgi:hypothetical protein